MILVTGANGFVGSALCSEFLSRKLIFKGAVRQKNLPLVSKVSTNTFSVGDINGSTDWSSRLVGVDCIVHTASLAHAMHKKESKDLAAYRSVNIEGTRQLAEQAAAMGVKRFVYISSIKVNGESTNGRRGKHFSSDKAIKKYTFMDIPAPEDIYGKSKWKAEQVLWKVSAKTGLEVVVVRPPLVYGPGVNGNLSRLLGLVSVGLPLPLGLVQNQRSLIGLDNLIDVIIRCIDHPKAAGQTFLVSDGNDLSTPDLLRQMSLSMGNSMRFLPVPVSMLRLAGRILGKQPEIDRLTGSLQIDNSHTCKVLNWVPSVSVAEGIRIMVQGR
jgi:nucleoside-diphosphate-sugar epimerase